MTSKSADPLYNRRRRAASATLAVFWVALILQSCLHPAAAEDRVAREAVEALEAYAVYKMAQYPEAFERFLALAQKNNIQGMLNAANMLQAGLGTSRDETAALGWYRRAADRGSAIGMFYVGQAYLRGVGTEADSRQARSWMLRAAEAGSSEAQFELGKLLLQAGRRDDGLDRIRLAAEAGDIHAARYLDGLAPAQLDDHGIAAGDRLLITAAWDAIDRAALNRNAPGIVHYLAHDAEVKIRLPGSLNWTPLDRRSLRDFWQQTFDRVDDYTRKRSNKLYRLVAGSIVVDSVIEETLALARHSESLRLEESAELRIDHDRVIIESITIIVTRI